MNKARARHLPLKYYLEVKVEGTSILETYFCLCFQLHVFKDICLHITDSFAALEVMARTLFSYLKQHHLPKNNGHGMIYSYDGTLQIVFI